MKSFLLNTFFRSIFFPKVTAAGSSCDSDNTGRYLQQPRHSCIKVICEWRLTDQGMDWEYQCLLSRLEHNLPSIEWWRLVSGPPKRKPPEKRTPMKQRHKDRKFLQTLTVTLSCDITRASHASDQSETRWPPSFVINVLRAFLSLDWVKHDDVTTKGA